MRIPREPTTLPGDVDGMGLGSKARMPSAFPCAELFGKLDAVDGFHMTQREMIEVQDE